MKSVWQEAELPQFPQLQGEIRTDVLIIGGGLAGILTAYFLHQRGIKYVLAEKDRICSGNTGRTTAKVTVQHGLIYHKIIKRYGVEAAQQYLQANQAALAEYAGLCRQADCGWEEKDNFVYSLNAPEKLERELEALRRLGCAAEFCDTLPLPIRTAGAVKMPHQAQFHPLKFVAAIAGGLHIYENTPVREMVGRTAVTDKGKITAQQVICTTHFPFINKHGSYFLKLYQDRSYVIALEGAQDVDGMYVDESEGGLSFRNHDGLLLLGGGGGRTGKENGAWQELRDFAQAHYPRAQERYFWAAQDCMSLDGIPYIGQYSGRTPGFYVASGFNKWGMTGSMAAAMILRDEILGTRQDYARVFDPSRSILHPQLLRNGVESAVNLLSPRRKTCPHLGCALKWNRAEHSWDCPCHGSRFSREGKLMDNPATGDLPGKAT